MLLRTVRKECDRIAPALATGVPASDLELDETLEIPQSRQLLNALNARRNFAVQHILGISVDGLREMFTKLRKALLKEKRRLVLLLEDVTSWERSEEHTSELQSLMRISYAVFCLKKKKHTIYTLC